MPQRWRDLNMSGVSMSMPYARGNALFMAAKLQGSYGYPGTHHHSSLLYAGVLTHAEASSALRIG